MIKQIITMNIFGSVNHSQKSKKIIEKIVPILLGLLPIIVTFLGEKFVPLTVVLLALFFFFEENKKENFIANKSLLIPYIIYVFVFILYSFFAVETKLAMKVLERQVSLLLIPIVVFSSNLNKDRIKVFLRIFIMGMLLILIYSLAKFYWFIYTETEWIEIMNKNSGNTTYLQFKYPHLIGAHPTYWSYLLILANTFLLSNPYFKTFSNRYWVITLLVLFNINVFYLSARTPMVINILIHLLSFIIYLKNYKVSGIRIFVTVLIVFLVGVFALNSPLIGAKILSIVNDERVFLWPTAFDQIKENNFILGEGLGQGQKILEDYIIENGDPRLEYKEYDLHNQYLKHYLDMGFFGIISLIYLLISPFLRLRTLFNFSNLPLLGFGILFILSLFTESAMYLIKGVIIFAVFSSALIKNHIDTLESIE